MSAAAKNRIKATATLEPVSGPGIPPDMPNREEWAAWMIDCWRGYYVAFDHPQHGRAYGRFKSAQYVGKDDAYGLPDFDVSIESIRTGEAVTVRLVAAKACFYQTEADARRDPLLVRERAKEGQG